MPDRNRDPREYRGSRDTRDSRDYRDSRDSRDYRDYRDEREGWRARELNRDRAEFGGYGDYGDYGTDDVRSYGAAPRTYPWSPRAPYWLRDENPRQGFSAPRDYLGDRDESRFSAFANGERWRGRFFGRGPKGYRRSDERIREEISDRLMTHPDVDASDIEVQVENGIVTLGGTVDTRHEKRIAEFIAEDALGVDDVQNQLSVQHGFWASLTGERAHERELRREPVREREVGNPSALGTRATATRSEKPATRSRQRG